MRLRWRPIPDADDAPSPSEPANSGPTWDRLVPADSASTVDLLASGPASSSAVGPVQPVTGPGVPDTPGRLSSASQLAQFPGTPAAQSLAASSSAAAIYPVIELRGMARTFPGPPPVEAVRPSWLTVAAGDYVSIIGPSGSGKSTLLHLLGLLDRPTDGEFLLNGIPTTTASEKQRSALRAACIGFVFQAFHLLPGRTVLDNVMLAMLYNGTSRAEREPAARAALDRVHLSHRTDFYPTVLSGGERQRVAIARAVAAGPQILLADEPTGNLDSHNSAEILDLFDELSADGQTLLVITHDPLVSARAQRVVSITDGELTETGRPIEVAR